MGDMTEQDLMDMAVITQLCVGDGKGASVDFELDGTQINVSIFPSNGLSTKDTLRLQQEDPLQDRLIDLLDLDWMCRDYDDHRKRQYKVLGIILKAGKPLFSQLTPSQQPPPREHPTLQQLLFAKILYFRLEADTGPASVVPIESSEAFRADRAFEKELDICGHIPWYTPEDIVVRDVFLRAARTVTATVYVDGRDMFCKSQGELSWLLRGPVARELECLGKILRAFPHQGSIRVPQLLGYVHDKDTKRILGFLRQWVPGRNLGEIDVAATAAETKRKWASQIRESVELLHKQGLVWGNARPRGVIIDEQDDAWLIDFGGGFSEGWVDMELEETTEGDEQGLDRIVKFLGGDDGVVLSS